MSPAENTSADNRSATGPEPVSRPDTVAPVLRARGLTVRYGSVTAVDGVDLEIPHLGAVALLGANGAGKTSLLTAVSGLTPHEGTIELEGRSVSNASAERIARMGVAHVPEGRRLFPNLTVHENLQVARSGRGKRSSAHDPDAVYELFAALVPLRKRQAWSLSGGEQQMVAIGRALCAAPRILLLDEPTLGLAPVVVDLLYGALQQLRGEVALLVVEQATELALAICDEAYVLHTGRIALRGTAAEVAARDDLMTTYLDGA